MHTYLRVKDVTKTTISGLIDSKYIDKVSSLTKTETSNNLSLISETDRVYTPPVPANSQKSIPITVNDSESKKVLFEISRDNLEDVVVWNPWEEKSKGMGDFEPKNGWLNMLCVEVGAVREWQKLEAGEAFEGGQIIKAAL